MINTEETCLPNECDRRILSAEETLPPNGNSLSNSNALILIAGESVADSYIINSALSEQGKQSNVYLAKKWGKSYVIKMYHTGWNPSYQLQSFLTNVEHPNIAKVIDCGKHNGQYYEIYEYHSEGTLEQSVSLSNANIQSVIVPSINEGLHELHSNGIVHCDIKPSNLFYGENSGTVVIGDCGISGYTNTNGKLVDSIRGTPEYAPRVRSLLWTAAMSPAYDYGSFGLVLCRLVLGHSLFAGMSVEEIASAWENGIELPSQIQGRLISLIKGLLTEDEQQRWGYIQVKRWCEGEYMRPVNRNIYAHQKKSSNVPLIFGRFDGQILSVSTLHQLVNAIHEHWDQATRIIKRRELVEFVRQFDAALSDKVRELSLFQDLDSAVFRLLNLIESDSKGIFYCTKNYESLTEYIESLSSGKDPIAVQFLASGLLLYYLREKKYDRVQVEKLDQFIKRNGCDNMTSIRTICFAVQNRNSIEVFGQTIDSLDSLVSVIALRTTKDISDLLETDQLKAWLHKLGFEKEMKKMNELEDSY